MSRIDARTMWLTKVPVAIDKVVVIEGLRCWPEGGLSPRHSVSRAGGVQ